MRGVDLRDRQAHLAEQLAEQMGKVQKRARPWRSITALVMALVAATVSAAAHQQHDGHSHRTTWTVVWLASTFLFVGFGGSATLGLSKRVWTTLRYRFGSSHATLIRVVLVFIGWITVLAVTLDLLGVSIERLLLGTALTGVVLGIAAQQSLGNLFAGIVLLISKPFAVGDAVKISAGALGGSYEGEVIEIGLTYVRLQGENGGITNLPNAGVMAAATSHHAVERAAEPAAEEDVTGADPGKHPERPIDKGNPDSELPPGAGSVPSPGTGDIGPVVEGAVGGAVARRAEGTDGK